MERKIATVFLGKWCKALARGGEIMYNDHKEHEKRG
jgi:hypothetical protein